MATKKPTIAIVGAGFSGCLVAVHLLQQAQRPLRLVLIDRGDAPGRGVAYRDQPECHLLNVRAEAMSAFPERPDHFLDWLNHSYSPCHPVGVAEFLPRRIYGFYIQWLLAEAAQGARRGVSLEFRSDEALGLRQGEDGQLTLRLRSGSLRAQRLVLALGNPGPADPPLANPDFHRSPRYLGHAWSTPGLHALRADEDLLLVGSGLTALDWLAALQAGGHRGRIYMLSRRGLLPQPHRPAPPHALSFDPQALPPGVRPLLRRLRAEAELVHAKGGDWRAVIDGLRPHTQALWQRWPAQERRRFLRHARPYWEVHRHRAAPRVLEQVQALLASGRLQLLAGRLLEVTDGAEAALVRVQPRLGAAPLQLRVQRVINCTGPESNYRRLNHPLLVSLGERGLVQFDPLGMGLLTDAHGALIGADGKASERLHTLGPPRKGQLWETTAVPEIRVQAKALAHRLLLLDGADARSAPALLPQRPWPSV